MMQQAWDFPYAEGADYQAVRLPYEGGAADMLIILPEEGRFGQVEKRLGVRLLDEVNESLAEGSVELTMPRFDFDGNLKLYEVLHKATIAVDEKGTEAAAATAILAMPTAGGGQPKTMTLNRPFIFAIQERETGTILFLGRVTDPS